MLIPAPRHDRKQRHFAAFAATGLMMLGSIAALKIAPVPELASGNSRIRELDPLFLERYSAPPRENLRNDESIDEATEREDDAAVAMERRVTSAIDALSERFASPGAIVESEEESRRNESRGLTPAAEDRFADLFGEASAEIAAPVATAGPARSRPGRSQGLALNSSGVRAQQPNRDERIPSSGLVAPEAGRVSRNTSSPEVVVREYEPEALTRSEVDLLSSWMSSNRADLPVGVKVHMRYQPEFETASASLQADGHTYQLYLMFKPTLRELHILLVEEDRSVYLIDRGFQAQSRSLREGVVQRLNGEIVAIDSQAGIASGERAAEFYNIFLSWWETSKSQ